MYYLRHPFYTLLFVFVFLTSCIGQVNPNLPKGQDSNPKTNTEGQPTIIRTQGSNQYGSVSCGLQDKAGYLWFGTSGEGIYRYDGQSFTNFIEKDGLCSNNVIAILEDKAGYIWIGTSAGLCRYDGKTFTKVPISMDKEGSLSSPHENNLVNAQPDILSIMQDRTGKIWFGTGKDGVYCYDPAAQRGTGGIEEAYFTHFLQDDGVINKSGLRLFAIMSIVEDKKGNIWFTTWFEGLCCYDGKSIVNYKPNGDVWFGSILEDRNGNLWFGTRDHGAYCYDGKTFTNFFADTKIFNGCWVCTMVEDNAGNIWFGTEFSDMGGREKFGGVWCYNPSTSLLLGSKSMTNLTMKDGLSNHSVFSITIDHSGKFWFGTRDMGLCSYDGKKFTDFSDKGSKDIRHIFEDQAGNLWFGTNGDGVCRYNPSVTSTTDSKSFTYFTVKEGLSGKDVRCITEDKNGNLWFGTNGGVSKFDGKHFTNFTVQEGLSSNEIWSLLIDKTGTLWVGTLEGVCRYNTSTVAAGSKVFSPFPIPAAEQNDFSRPVSGTKIIWDMIEDRAGNIWFATNGRGAYRYDGKSLSNISQQDGLCNDYVNCILEDKKGNLWFATQHGGVSRYDPSASRGGSKSQSAGQARFTTFTVKEGLCSNEVWKMFEDKTGNIWFAANSLVYPATHSGSTCRYDGKKFTSFTDNDGLLSKNYVQSIFEDRKGMLWLGSAGGLCRFEGNSFINITKAWSLGEM